MCSSSRRNTLLGDHALGRGPTWAPCGDHGGETEERLAASYETELRTVRRDVSTVLKRLDLLSVMVPRAYFPYSLPSVGPPTGRSSESVEQSRTFPWLGAPFPSLVGADEISQLHLPPYGVAALNCLGPFLATLAFGKVSS